MRPSLFVDEGGKALATSGSPRVEDGKHRLDKGRIHRVVPLPPALARALNEYRRE